jgi:hypothetical protein
MSLVRKIPSQGIIVNNYLTDCLGLLTTLRYLAWLSTSAYRVPLKRNYIRRTIKTHDKGGIYTGHENMTY